MNAEQSILSMTPEAVFRPEWVPEYRRRLQVVALEIAKVGDRLYLLNRLREFPAGLLLRASPPPHSWAIIVMAVFESLILALWRVALDDTSADGLTVRQFRNQVMENVQHAELKKRLAAELRQRSFDDNLADFEQRVRLLRTTTIAHQNLEVRLGALDGGTVPARLGVAELQDYVAALKNFFDGLCIGEGWSLLSAPYVTAPSTEFGVQTDIALVLNDIARGSPLLTMPEQDPVGWSIRRPSLSFSDLCSLDHWRRRVGLPPLPDSTSSGAS
jgi:hypothetical protein